MLEKFAKNLKENFPFVQNKRFYVAVSGGIDSMVLLHLFQHFPFAFGVLHCNFKLRGEESDADMRFIHDYCEENRLQLKIGFFETEAIAKDLKLSIQETARNLRYNWFYEQMDENNADFVATAHHVDDDVETFLINFVRGTGLEGLTGIPAQNDRIFRPLLPFTREEIENYAKKNKIKWREDSSNASDKYFRNKLRHHIIPLFKEMNPNFLDSFQQTQSHLKDAQSIVNDGEYIIFKEVVTENLDGTVFFDLKKLVQLQNYSAYLYQWLKEFGFTAWNDVYNLVNAQSGKQVFSETHVLLKDRENLILSERKSTDKSEVYFVDAATSKVNIPLKLKLSKAVNIFETDSNCIFVDEDKLKFPLIIRKWNEGDYFYPSGMNGKKKLSKYFKDEKYSLLDKENQWLLCSEDQIVWIIGKRADNRFTVTEKTKAILKIEVNL